MSFSSHSANELINQVQNIVEIDEDLYHCRHQFRLEKNEVVHLCRRVSIDFTGDDYENTEEFYYHIFFSADGSVWWFIDVDFDTRLGWNTEVYWTEEYDRYFRGRDSRYYCFSDCIRPGVAQALEQVIAGRAVDHGYIWEPGKFEIMRKVYKKGIRVGIFSAAEETNDYFDVRD